MSTFSGISGALSALYSQRRGMELTGQNIANANTVGYSRQRADLQAIGGPTQPAMHATSDGSAGGVTIAKIDRLRDQYLESRARAEHANGAYLTAQTKVLAQIEDVFAEPSDTALQSQLADFWSSWDEVANQPGDTAARTQLLQRAGVVVDGLRAAHGGLDTQWNTIRTQSGGYLRDVNENAAAVAQLNDSIVKGAAGGVPVNELMDQRDVHLVKLAELIGATTVTRPDGSADVYVEGSTLVSGAAARKLELVGATDMGSQAGDKVRLQWDDTDARITAVGGTFGATLEALGETIPGYSTKLDEIAVKLATAVNTEHVNGWGLDGVRNRPFFTTVPSTDPMSATTITVAITLPQHVGASLTNGSLDSSNADTMARLGRKTDSADAAYRDMVVGLGVSTQAAQRRADIQATVTDSVDASRMGESGVNLDEEMTNMLSFQRAYEAASRVLTTLDSMLDQLINRTGLVGR